MMSIQHLIVTGGTGYLGSHFVQFARARGLNVTLLGQRPVKGVRVVQWALPMPLPADAINPAIPLDNQALVHLAHDWRMTEKTLNTDGIRQLLTSGRAAGLKHIVFASSQSARKNAINHYGRIKWAAEQELTQPGEVSARIGLVYGGPPQAMYGLLCRMSHVVPVLPMIDPWRHVQPIHIQEVCDGLLRLTERNDNGWFGLASPIGIPFGQVLKLLAKELYGKRLHIVPVPLQIALTSCDLINWIPLAPQIDRERILGLAGTRPMLCGDHLEALNLTIEPFEHRIRREPLSRKAALREARLVLGFITRPSAALLKKYAIAISQKQSSGVLALPWRSMLSTRRFGEPLGAGAIFGQRLKLATALIDADPVSNRDSGRIAIFVATALDVMALPLRLVSGALYR